MARELGWSVDRSDVSARRILIAVRERGSREGVTLHLSARSVGALVATLRMAIDDDPQTFEAEFITQGEIEVNRGR